MAVVLCGFAVFAAICGLLFTFVCPFCSRNFCSFLRLDTIYHDTFSKSSNKTDYCKLAIACCFRPHAACAKYVYCAETHPLYLFTQINACRLLTSSVHCVRLISVVSQEAARAVSPAFYVVFDPQVRRDKGRAAFFREATRLTFFSIEETII